MDALIDGILQALVPIAAAAVTALIVQLFRKIGIAIDADRQAQLEYYARQAVLRAEEQAAAYAKDRVVKLLPADKLRMAITDLVGKVPRIDDAEAKAIIEAVLPQVGVGAAAGLREVGKALVTPEAKR